MEPKNINVILLNVRFEHNNFYLNYYCKDSYQKAVLLNPEVIKGNLITGTEIKIKLANGQAELLISEEDLLPDDFINMLSEQPPEQSVFFGITSKPENGKGRYYMLRDHNDDGLLLCTGKYRIRDRVGRCERFDGQWPLRYNMVENFFYGFDRPECGIRRWKHPEIKLKDIDDNLVLNKLSRRHRDYAAGWHRYNFFFSDDWSARFYRRQARLGYIAITHTENGKHSLTPQLQREYAVLDWENLRIDPKVKRIFNSNRIETGNIRLRISPDPSEVLKHLVTAWKETWISDKYIKIIKELAAENISGKNRKIKIYGVTLTAGKDDTVIAGELGYTIGKTYTSLSGFFHRGNKEFNNFGKLQMVMLADILKKSGIEFWNLGQPYMEYKLKLGAEVVPRGIFLKRWDKAVRGRTVQLT